MAQLDYAASLIQDKLLDVHSRGSQDCLSAFTDRSSEAKPGQSISMIEQGALTVTKTGGNSVSAQALSVTPTKLIIDQPAMVSVYVDEIDDIFGGNGNFAQTVAEDAFLQLREAVAADILDQARDVLIASGDSGLVANAGADALTEADLNSLEALIRKRAGVSRVTPLSYVGSTGFEAAIRGFVNFQLPGSDLGTGVVNRVNGSPLYVSSSLETSAGDRTVATTASTITSNVGLQTVASGHGFVRGALVTTSGLTANASSATAITATSATSISCAITASDGAQADGVGTISSASGIGFLFVKPWAAYGIAGNGFKVHVIKSPTGAGWVVQVTSIYGVKVRSGGVAAVHVPAV